MPTKLEFNRGNSLHALRGLNSAELQKATESAGGKTSAIETRVAGLSSKEASVFLATLKGKIQNRNGYLKLMHTEHNRTMSFETKSGLGAFFTKNERRSETESALKGLFRALKLKPEQLEQLNSQLEAIGGDHLQAKNAASIIDQALAFSRQNAQPAEPKISPASVMPQGDIHANKPQGEVETRLGKNLDAFRTISVGGLEIGGSARPAGHYLKNEATVPDVLKDIKEAGFTHILSLDQSERPEYKALKEGLETVGLNHLAPDELNIEDAGFKTDEDVIIVNGEKKDIYEGSKPLNVDALKAFKAQVDNVNKDGGKMLVHCGAGAGRTGTMLASLLLADLVKNNPQYKVKRPKNQPVEFYDGSTANTTPLVALAIETLRQADKNFTGKETSVETQRELRLLEDYEKALFANS